MVSSVDLEMTTSLKKSDQQEAKKSAKNTTKPSIELYKPPVLRHSKRMALQGQINKEEAQTASNFFHEPTVKLLNSDAEKRKTSMPLLASTSTPTNTSLLNEVKESSMDFDELVLDLRHILDKDHNQIGAFLASKLVTTELAYHLGEYIVKYAIEDCRQKQSRKAIIARVSACAEEEIFAGVCTALERYFECRDLLREDEHHGQVWKNFISLTFELAQLPRRNDRLTDLIFAILEYLFTPPVVYSLQLSELECVLSTLMMLGRCLELEYPTKMGNLREQLRDAFLTITEGWARKMALLMVELGANGWKLSPELEEYYFR